MGQEPKKPWFDEAVLDPARVYKSPAEVLQDSRLDDDGMRRVLKSWEEDAKRLLESDEEGMTGGESSPLKAVQAALAELDRRDECVRDKPPTASA